MAIIDILATAQGGQFFANVGNAAGLSTSAAETAMAALCPAIANHLKDKAKADPEAFENLMELLEEGGDSSDLDDVTAMTGPEAIADGEAILEDLFGSPAAAAKAVAKLVPGLGADELAKLSAISATSVLATLAATNSATLAGNTVQQAADTGGTGGGFFSILFAALLKGLMQGAAKQLAPKRRRRRSYTSYYGRKRTTRRTTTRRRTTTPSLDQIFSEILGNKKR